MSQAKHSYQLAIPKIGSSLLGQFEELLHSSPTSKALYYSGQPTTCGLRSGMLFNQPTHRPHPESMHLIIIVYILECYKHPYIMQQPTLYNGLAQ